MCLALFVLGASQHAARKFVTGHNGVDSFGNVTESKSVRDSSLFATFVASSILA